MSNRNREPGESEPVGEIVRIYRRGTVWYATYQREGRQHRRSLRTTNVKEARRRAMKLEDKVFEGIHRKSASPPKPRDIESLIGDYLALARTNGRRVGTVQRYESALKHFREIAQATKRSRIDQIDLSFVDTYRARRTKAGRKPKTVALEILVIRQLVNFALRTKVIDDDPLAELRLPKVKSSPQPCWSWEEVERILDAADEPRRSMFVLLAETGMRFGELQWLTWEDLDFNAEILHIRPKGGWQPKSGEARVVPMSSRLRATLEALPRRARWVFTAARSKKYPKGDNQVSERRLLTSLKRLLQKIDMPTTGKLHTFRHSFISASLANGVPASTLRAWVGHVSDDILALYTHVHDETSRSAMQAFEQRRRPSDDTPNPAETDSGE